MVRNNGSTTMKYFKALIFYYFLFAINISYAGEFKGEIITKWINDRDMEIQNEVTYIDDSNVEWIVPTGAIVNGASIPRILWDSIGSPFVGLYRDASVFHDHYCDTKERDWKDVHKMFYDAMIDKGVGKIKAKTMFAAVYVFGPRWEKILGVGSNDFFEWTEKISNGEHNALQNWVEQEDPTIDQIIGRVDSLTLSN